MKTAPDEFCEELFNSFSSVQDFLSPEFFPNFSQSLLSKFFFSTETSINTVNSSRSEVMQRPFCKAHVRQSGPLNWTVRFDTPCNAQAVSLGSAKSRDFSSSFRRSWIINTHENGLGDSLRKQRQTARRAALKCSGDALMYDYHKVCN